MRRIVLLAPRWLKLGVIVIPVLLYALYLGLFAAPRYVSETKVTVHTNATEGGSIPGAALALAGITPASHEDTVFVREFIHSQALAQLLDKRLKLREHYASHPQDRPFHLATDASLEDYVAFFRNRIDVQFDERSGILLIRSQAFDPQFAQALTKAVLEESERFVNEMSHAAARERMKFAEGELAKSATLMRKVQRELLAFQSQNRLLDPAMQAQAASALTAEFTSARARLEAELNGLKGFLQDDAYQVRALRSRIAALDQQIAAERLRATAENQKGERLNKLTLDFQQLQMESELARDSYKLALAAVENSRIEATRQLKNLVVIEPPSLPETAEYPRIAYNLLTLFVVCLLLYAITRLVLATIREHLD